MVKWKFNYGIVLLAGFNHYELYQKLPLPEKRACQSGHVVCEGFYDVKAVTNRSPNDLDDETERSSGTTHNFRTSNSNRDRMSVTYTIPNSN